MYTKNKIKKNVVLINEMRVENDESIKQAINNVLRVRITYNDKKDKVISKSKGKNERYILPVAYGLTRNGKRAVRAYQTAGSTKRGVPKWKLFLLDNIVSWSNGKKSFKGYKQALIDLGLNVNGDKHMTTLYAITPLANPNVQVSKYGNEINPEPITKMDVTPTTSVQTATTPSDKNISNKTILNTHSIDNVSDLDYNSDIEAPETKPITKTNVSNNQNIDNTGKSIEQPEITNNVEPVTTEPISKNDVNNEPEHEANNDIDLRDSDFVKKFNDLNNRMNNLYNNEEY